MGYLSNRSINLLNAHSLLVVVSDQAKVLFSAAFFLSEGIPPWAIALLWAWHFAARLLARTGTIRLVRHAGLKASIILGALGNALAFFLLVPVHGLGWLVVAYFTAIAVFDSLYWMAYHSLFCIAGDHEHRGKQMAVRSVLGMLATAIVPAVSGVLAATAGFGWVFLVGAAAVALSALPVWLVALPEIPPVGPVREGVKTPKWGFTLFAAKASYDNSYLFVWGMMVFLIAGNVALFGGIIAVGIALQALLFLMGGYWLDKGKGKAMLLGGGPATIMKIAMQAGFVFTPLAVIATNALNFFKDVLFDPAVNLPYYNRGKAARDPVWYMAWGEMGWDVGAIATLLLVAALNYAGLPLRAIILLGVVGVIVPGWMAYKRYGNTQHPAKGWFSMMRR
ncbi:hypothetical protein J4435_00430 [Candidatus Woesearchaeota archaeon]|nr:MAG: hypothetical protein QT04_C0044G0031 [archaeon GW2011_AR11]MBS3110541.1 hypothetical protein [Candidatus Woesearchaeota archaeon]